MKLASDIKINDIYSEIDEEKQKDLDNIINQEIDGLVTDGQKRYKTLSSNSSSNYPKPKTMFYVVFDVNDEINKNLSEDMFNNDRKNGEEDSYYNNCVDMSKYVLSVTPPTITYTSQTMNQYNRIKKVVENITYGDLKITFYDVKDSIVQQVFLNYLKYADDNMSSSYNDYATYGESKIDYTTNWGITLNTNKKMFKSVMIAEMFIDRLIVYSCMNPVLKSITFDEDKLGDYSPKTITATFEIEGITNDMKLPYSILSGTKIKGPLLRSLIGDKIENNGGEVLSHFLQKQWNKGFGVGSSNKNENGEESNMAKDVFENSYYNRIYNQVKDSNEKLISIKDLYYNNLNDMVYRINGNKIGIARKFSNNTYYIETGILDDDTSKLEEVDPLYTRTLPDNWKL